MAKERSDKLVDANGQPLPLSAEQQREYLNEMERVRAAARLATGAYHSPMHGCVFFTGKRPLDLHDSVIAVPLPFLLQLIGGVLASDVAPLLANVQRAALDQPIDTSGSHS